MKDKAWAMIVAPLDAAGLIRVTAIAVPLVTGVHGEAAIGEVNGKGTVVFEGQARETLERVMEFVLAPAGQQRDREKAARPAAPPRQAQPTPVANLTPEETPDLEVPDGEDLF